MTKIIRLTVMLLLIAMHCNISAANKTDSIFKIAGDHGQLRRGYSFRMGAAKCR